MKASQICISILGPTASGKSLLASNLATKVGGEILSLDSTAIYRGFDIGSAKPSKRDRELVPHHLIDVLNPDEECSAGKFVRLAEDAMDDISKRCKLPLIVGGTYFYLRALEHGMYDIPEVPSEVTETIENEFAAEEGLNLEGIHEALKSVDPASAQVIHKNDQYRMVRALSVFRATKKKMSEFKPVRKSETPRLWMKYALLLSRGELTARIQRRTDEMLANGLVEETRKLREACPSSRALGSIGYSEAVRFLDKKISEKDMRNEIIDKTRQLARRQMTWLRSDPEVRFVDGDDVERMVLEIENLRSVIKGAKI